VRFAVVGIVTLCFKFHSETLFFLTHLVILRDLLYIDACGNGILVENNVVGTTLVVDPGMYNMNRIYKKCYISGISCGLSSLTR